MSDSCNVFKENTYRACRWHQDIKPANILIKSRAGASSVYDFESKLADLGLSHFEKYTSKPDEMTTTDAHGTRAYGKVFNEFPLSCRL